MNKLQRLLAWLNPDQVFETQSYIYFQTSTGEPHTVTLDEHQQLVETGPTPGGSVNRFDDLIQCLKHLKSLDSDIVPLSGIVNHE